MYIVIIDYYPDSGDPVQHFPLGKPNISRSERSLLRLVLLTETR